MRSLLERDYEGPGPVERAVAELVDELGDGATERTRTDRVLEAQALNLARQLDLDAGMATAATNRELRETIGAMTGEVTDGLQAFLLELLDPDGVPAPVRNRKK